MKIKSIDIKQFRGFPHINLDDFGFVNLLIGENNCGKTSILEALFLMLGISNPQLSLNINSFRDLCGIFLLNESNRIILSILF